MPQQTRAVHTCMRCCCHRRCRSSIIYTHLGHSQYQSRQKQCALKCAAAQKSKERRGNLGQQSSDAHMHMLLLPPPLPFFMQLQKQLIIIMALSPKRLNLHKATRWQHLQDVQCLLPHLQSVHMVASCGGIADTFRQASQYTCLQQDDTVQKPSHCIDLSICNATALSLG